MLYRNMHKVWERNIYGIVQYVVFTYLLIMFLSLFPLVCQLQQATFKQQEIKTALENPLTTSPNILVGTPG